MPTIEEGSEEERISVANNKLVFFSHVHSLNLRPVWIFVYIKQALQDYYFYRKCLTAPVTYEMSLWGRMKIHVSAILLTRGSLR